ncbi:hypothetical protein B0H34DRAFT_202105 [Crassisporium funariophilum]|nr:hypothetical protein B0H34DRAFT_202105 [Crassisporium funariophilum]
MYGRPVTCRKAYSHSLPGLPTPTPRKPQPCDFDIRHRCKCLSNGVASNVLTNPGFCCGGNHGRRRVEEPKQVSSRCC